VHYNYCNQLQKYAEQKIPIFQQTLWISDKADYGCSKFQFCLKFPLKWITFRLKFCIFKQTFYAEKIFPTIFLQPKTIKMDDCPPDPFPRPKWSQLSVC